MKIPNIENPFSHNFFPFSSPSLNTKKLIPQETSSSFFDIFYSSSSCRKNFVFVVAVPLTLGIQAALVALGIGIAASVTKAGVDKANEAKQKKQCHKKPPFNGAELGLDPTRCPAPGFEWKGSGPPESGRGNWVKGSGVNQEDLHPDFEHKDHPPHWDYRGPDFPHPGIRIYPDGNWECK